MASTFGGEAINANGKGWRPPALPKPKVFKPVSNKTSRFQTMNDVGNVGRTGPATTQYLKDAGAQMKANAAASDFSGGGMDSFDWMQALTNGGPRNDGGGGGGGGGGYGGGGGGGGGGGAVDEGPSPEMIAAFGSYVDSLGGTGLADALAKIRGELGDTYKYTEISDDPVHERYDQFSGAIGDSTRMGLKRLRGIGDTLDTRYADTADRRRGIGRENMAALDAISNRAMSAAGADNANINSVLGAFGAGSLPGSTGNLQNLLNASRANAQSNTGLFNQAQADRAGLSADLQADVGMGMSQQEAALLARIASQRAQGLESNSQRRQANRISTDQARASAEAALWIQEAQAAQAQTEAIAKARLQAAELGIEL